MATRRSGWFKPGSGLSPCEPRARETTIRRVPVGASGSPRRSRRRIRVKQGLRCLSGMNRPLDTQRLQRLGLQRTGDAVADRMLDVAATEIEAGNAGANELGFLGDMLKGIFEAPAKAIEKARATGGPTSAFMDSAEKTIELMRRNLGSSEMRHLQLLLKGHEGASVPRGVKSAALDSAIGRLIAGYISFYRLVDGGKPWDIKRQFPQWSLDPASNKSYFRDIWGNVHYGYLGLAAGFSESNPKQVE